MEIFLDVMGFSKTIFSDEEDTDLGSEVPINAEDVDIVREATAKERNFMVVVFL